MAKQIVPQYGASCEKTRRTEYRIPAPQFGVVADGLGPLEALDVRAYAPQPRRSLNVITQASPGYPPSQPNTTGPATGGPHGQ
ncbi:hypothetical protein DHEL01_v200466 [Diaporthe helianthi]|uniref:Uncharacterized protein n=1 Tax=Diaporthe helianthi TaxID=158607 RepID=A0A2P5IF65_DIAHE|nr:hypothetical protein DHEL01_v200466 [Diaporthe helianthi]